jgi:hypothetical protein
MGSASGKAGSSKQSSLPAKSLCPARFCRYSPYDSLIRLADKHIAIPRPDPSKKRNTFPDPGAYHPQKEKFACAGSKLYNGRQFFAVIMQADAWNSVKAGNSCAAVTRDDFPGRKGGETAEEIPPGLHRFCRKPIFHFEG